MSTLASPPRRWIASPGERRMRAMRPGTWAVAAALVALSWSTLAMEVPIHGWTAGFGLLAGTLSYAFMAIAVVLATRRRSLERWFGPLDRLYRAHRMLGIGTVAGLGLHLLLRNDPEGSRLIDLAADLVFRPLGVAGAVLLGLSVVLAVAVKVPYHRWQPIHLATMVAFALLTAHATLAAGALDPTVHYSVSVGIFSAAGTIAIALRLIDKAIGGVSYQVVALEHGVREVEVTLAPRGRRTLEPTRAGQFAFLAARVDGRRETHPFTVTSAGSSTELSFCIRSLGDWTSRIQDGLVVGDSVRVEGPFGDFAPLTAPDPSRPEVWIGAGAGVTPFVSALRTAASSPDATRDSRTHRPQVELVIAARDAADVPCWRAVTSSADQVPWIRLTTAFAADGDRLDARAIDRLIARTPDHAHWFLCGPSGLTSLIVARLRRAGVPLAAVHREVFDWRGPRVAPWRRHRRSVAARSSQVPARCQRRQRGRRQQRDPGRE